MAYPISWVTLKKYLDVSGDTEAAVRRRVKRSEWTDGVQCKAVDGGLWINLLSVERWVLDEGANGVIPTNGPGVPHVEAMAIERLIDAIRKHAVAPMPVSYDLWDTSHIGAYLKRSIDNVRKEIVCLPTFPRPVRLPVKGRAQALYKAREVIKWAESYTTHSK